MVSVTTPPTEPLLRGILYGLAFVLPIWAAFLAVVLWIL
jgi:hypothetical protein